ncbi:MFS transporter [Neofusicoccum parvum]|nr:MFS transporter [Neofusicoccum parvum]
MAPRIRPPTIITLPACGPPPLPPTSPTTNTFLAQRFGPAAGPRKRWLIYFVTGNPGLVGYYDLFLSHLHFLLSAHPTLAPRHAFDVFGRSLSGFEARGVACPSWPAGKGGSKGPGSPPFGLAEQIDGVEWALWDHVRGMREVGEDGEAVLVNGHGGEEGEEEEPRVVVIGHSVGAYMALEVVRRWREGLKKRGVGEKEEGVEMDADEKDGGRIVGGVCLFPTVTHIAKSSSGLKLTVRLTPPLPECHLRAFANPFTQVLLESIPTLPVIAHLLAILLTFFIPTAILTEILALVLNHPHDAARTTAEFLKSRHGVQQALHMARDELETITADAWDAEIWGAADPSPVGVPRPKLFFLFGQNDHWVADETRDDLIKARGRGRFDGEKWKPLMEVDEAGIPHGFCLGE